jgi:hypothetical protein
MIRQAIAGGADVIAACGAIGCWAVNSRRVIGKKVFRSDAESSMATNSSRSAARLRLRDHADSNGGESSRLRALSSEEEIEASSGPWLGGRDNYLTAILTIAA